MAPTLLVPTESDAGLEEAHVDALIGWVQAGSCRPVRAEHGYTATGMEGFWPIFFLRWF